VTGFIAADIGGTHARFARIRIAADGSQIMGTMHKYRVADFPSLSTCWHQLARDEGDSLPDKVSIAFAAPISSGTIKLTNSGWIIRRDQIAQDLGVSEVRLFNDFEAVAYAVSGLDPQSLPVIFGPDRPLPDEGTVTILGPGTGLGVALMSFEKGAARIIATEGAHMEFATVDAIDDRILAYLRGKYPRVSIERVISGPGLNNLYGALAVMSDERVEALDDAELWSCALKGTNRLAREALARFCLSLGTILGDLALAHGARSVVLTGSLMQRMRPYLVSESGFHSRFTAKGRSSELMRAIPVHLATHHEIGLYGAAVAWRNTERTQAGDLP